MTPKFKIGEMLYNPDVKAGFIYNITQNPTDYCIMWDDGSESINCDLLEYLEDSSILYTDVFT